MIERLWRQLVRFGFRLLYNELAWTYDLVSLAVSLGAWRAWQRASLPFIKDGRILEVGHGPGHLLAALSDAGYQTYGLDLSSHMARIAQSRTSVPLVRGRAQQLPFREATFDTVIATFPTDYITNLETLRSIHRALAPEGCLVIVPEGHLTGNTPLHRFIEWLFMITGQREGPFALDEHDRWPHPDPWQLLESQFELVGFRVEIEQVQLQRSAVSIVLAHKLLNGS